MNKISLITEDIDVGERVDVFLATKTGRSRNAVRKFADAGNIFIGDKNIKQNYIIRGGEEIIVFIPEPAEPEMKPENIPIKIVYEDTEIIVVNKPRGMVVHPAAGNFTGTLANALLHRCGGNLSGINGVLRPGIVHRIDKDTSGLIVAAKSDAAHKSLSAQFHGREVTKIYSALCCGNILMDSFTVNKPIGRDPRNRKKMAVTANGRSAVTHFKIVERLGRHTLVEAKLETGRTHQIRVHLASLGRPLYGDSVYCGKKFPDGINGQTLHAGTLGFKHPATGEEMIFNTELPDYFINILESLR